MFAQWSKSTDAEKPVKGSIRQVLCRPLAVQVYIIYVICEVCGLLLAFTTNIITHTLNFFYIVTFLNLAFIIIYLCSP